MADAVIRPFSVRAALFAIAFAIALLAGGGGAEGPLHTGLIAVIGTILLVSIATDQLFGLRSLPKSLYLPALTALALLLIPLLQLIPFPPGFWQSLPGRDAAASALRAADVAQAWRPLTLDSDATIRAAAAMLLPIALFIHAARSSRAEKLDLLGVMVACAAISALSGALQLAAGHPNWLSFYDGPTIGAASGLFANPNHQSLLMVCAMVATAILIRTARDRPLEPSSWAGQGKYLLWAMQFCFAIMALASGARAGLVLLALGLPASLLISIGSGSLLRWAIIMVAAIVLLWIVVVLYPSTGSIGVRESLLVTDDVRFTYFPDIFFTLQQYWWAGSGLGTFAEVFAPNENLDFARVQYLNHAHNDYIEWLVETGVVGASWLVIAAGVTAWVAFKGLTDKSRDAGVAAGGALIAGLIALHSFADYPLRAPAIAALAGVALGLLPSPVPTSKVNLPARGTLVPLLVAALLAIPIAAGLVRLFLVQSAVRRGQDGLAMQLGSNDSRVLAKRAEVALREGHASEAAQLAALSLAGQPINARALRILATAQDRQGKPSGPSWRLATSFGWRDGPTQLWAFRQALVDNEPIVAAIRADALLRTSNPPPQFLQLVRLAAREPRFASALARRLALRPAWRRSYFNIGRKSSADEAAGLISTLHMLSKAGTATSRADGQPLIALAIMRGEFDQAVEVDRLVAGPRGTAGNLIDDGGFSRSPEDYARNSTSFDWLLSSGPNTIASVDHHSSGSLLAETDGERTRIAASRYLRLPAGQYRLSYEAKSDGSRAFEVQLLCVGRPTPIAADFASESDEFAKRSLRFELDKACPLTRLVVRNLAVERAARAQFDNFELVPARWGPNQ